MFHTSRLCSSAIDFGYQLSTTTALSVTPPLLRCLTDWPPLTVTASLPSDAGVAVGAVHRVAAGRAREGGHHVQDDVCAVPRPAGARARADPAPERAAQPGLDGAVAAGGDAGGWYCDCERDRRGSSCPELFCMG